MGKRQRAAQQTRRKIVDAAQKLICEKGFTAVSVSDIAAEAGVAKGTFYTYFERKEDVVSEIIYRRYADIEAKALDSGDVEQQIAAFLRGSMQYIEQTGLHICQQWLNNSVHPDDIQGKKKLEYDLSVLQSLLRDAVARGELCARTPVEALAQDIAAAYYGIVTLWGITNGGMNPVDHMQRFGEQTLPSILKPYRAAAD